MSIATVEEIIAEIRAGRMVILVDEEDRENEGDLILASDFVTPEAINFMVTHARGLVCLTLTEEHCDQLDLPMMASRNGTQFGTNFTVSIEAAEGVTTGISAADRARTIQVAAAKNAKPSDLVNPGHIFPLRAQKGGVLMRAGHTEAGCDLTAMAGLTPAAVICEILKDDGTMARLPDLVEFAKKHGLKIGTIADMIQYRSRTESIVERVGERTMETQFGTFHAVAFRDRAAGRAHLALVKGTPTPDTETLVRVHEPSRCWTCSSASARRTRGACPLPCVPSRLPRPAWSCCSIAAIRRTGCSRSSPRWTRRMSARVRNPIRASTASARKSSRTWVWAKCVCWPRRSNCRAWSATIWR